MLDLQVFQIIYHLELQAIDIERAFLPELTDSPRCSQCPDLIQYRRDGKHRQATWVSSIILHAPPKIPDPPLQCLMKDQFA